MIFIFGGESSKITKIRQNYSPAKRSFTVYKNPTISYNFFFYLFPQGLLDYQFSIPVWKKRYLNERNVEFHKKGNIIYTA